MSHQEKEIESIRKQMLHVRSRMPYSMDIMRSETRQLLDWKYYVRKHPFATALVVAGTAYYLIPKKSHGRLPAAARNGRSSGQEQVEEAATKASLVSVAASFLGTLAARAITTYVTNRVQGYVASRGPRPSYAKKV